MHERELFEYGGPGPEHPLRPSEIPPSYWQSTPAPRRGLLTGLYRSHERREQVRPNHGVHRLPVLLGPRNQQQHRHPKLQCHRTHIRRSATDRAVRDVWHKAASLHQRLLRRGSKILDLGDRVAVEYAARSDPRISRGFRACRSSRAQLHFSGVCLTPVPPPLPS